MGRLRKIKWVGDPVLVKSDGFGVPDHAYENARSIVLPGLHGKGGTERILTKRDGFSRMYVWEKDNPTMTILMTPEDWALLHYREPDEFKDVTNEPEPELVRNDVIVIDHSAVSFARPKGIIIGGR